MVFLQTESKEQKIQDRFPKALTREGDSPAAQTEHCRSALIFISWSHRSRAHPLLWTGWKVINASTPLTVAKACCQHLPSFPFLSTRTILLEKVFSSFISNATIHLLLCVHIIFCPEPSTLSTTAEPCHKHL